MTSPYKPELASGNTGSPVARGMAGGNDMQPGLTSMHSYGTSIKGNAHVDVNPHAFATPMHNYGSGAVGFHQNKEVRSGPLPHPHMGAAPGHGIPS